MPSTRSRHPTARAAQAHPDANFSGGAFGSYLDSMTFKCGLLVRSWREPALMDAALRGGTLPSCRLSTITASQESEGTHAIMALDGEVRPPLISPDLP